MNWFFKKQQPLPPPIYKRRPIATVAIILSMIGMFVLGPIGYLWNGMAEELKFVKGKVEIIQKEKVDNENLKDTLTELKEQRKETRETLKEQNESIQMNQIAIKEILTRQQMIIVPKGLKLMGMGIEKEVQTDTKKQKTTLSPEEFEKYISMSPKIRAKYKKYLRETGKDVSSLPD